MSITKELLNARRVAVPVVGIASADQAACEGSIRQGCNGSIPLIHWDCVRGAVPLNEPGESALSDLCEGSSPADVTVEPVQFLSMCQKLADGTMLLMHNSHKFLEGAQFVQAVSNLRDTFKSNKRMLVLLAPSFSLPAELRSDLVLLDEPLPEREQVSSIISALCSDAGVADAGVADATEALVGLAAFSVEQSAAMSLTKSGLDIEACWKAKRKQVEQTPGLSMSDVTTKYQDIGGLSAVKDYFSKVFSGPCAPRLIIQFEEIEKLLAGTGSSGGPGDSSGTSQDQLQVILDSVESNGWLGALFLGPPGSGKSYFSQALAGEFGVRRIVFDLGAMKGSLVGESEQRIRAAIKTCKAIGGDRVLVCGTCNKLDSLAPELRRRFNSCGMWFFDLPSVDEKLPIWNISISAYKISNPVSVNDTGWSSANIRDCCRSARITGDSLSEAARSIVSATSQDGEGIERLRRLANGRFLSAYYLGPYKLQSSISGAAATGRAIGGSDAL